ncbi:MAG: hypothetical protein HZA60_05060 [Deltaproteobacteria bacterium]|nr:hypothetical protein [Deltaproteobacteria bacterium]
MERISLLLSTVFFFFCRMAIAGPAGPPAAAMQETGIGGKISGEVRLSGHVHVTGDLLVLPGAMLTVAPGTVLVFEKSESSKVDPEYFYGGTELVVRGALRASGARFLFPARSGGIVVDGGRAELSDCLVSGAETGITVLRGGSVAATGRLAVTDCKVGVALFPGGVGEWIGAGEVTLTKNGIAAVRFPGAPAVPSTFLYRQSEETDVLAWESPSSLPRGEHRPWPVPAAGALRLGDTFLDRNRTLSGDVVVDGVIRVAPGVTLTIARGSRLFFTFRDTDGDGIGENGIFLQGTLDARGTKERPIGFLPLDGAGWGKWDAINFMASDQGENVLENVEIAGAYRGLHAHFSRLRGKGIRISGCFRGIQFQESEMDLSEVEVADSLSALRCRDSDVRIDGFRARDTVFGGNFFRSRVKLSSPGVTRPGWYGFRFRESRVELARGEVREAMVGVSVQEGAVSLDRFSVEKGGLAGIALQEGDVRMGTCRVSGSRLDAISATNARVSVGGGALTGYGRYAVKLGGPAEVTMSGVEYTGGHDAGNPVYDGKVAPGLGVVRIE